MRVDNLSMHIAFLGGSRGTVEKTLLISADTRESPKKATLIVEVVLL